MASGKGATCVACHLLSCDIPSYPNTTNRLFLKRVDGKNILDRANTNTENQAGLKGLLEVLAVNIRILLALQSTA